MQALKELNDQENIADQDSQLQKSNIMRENSTPTNLKAKRFKYNEQKNPKEGTKFSEFNFNKIQKNSGKKNTTSMDYISNLIKKLPEYMKKKSKLSRKMVYKMISSCYQLANSQITNEGVNELLTISYDDISQKYGLKKVSDRKFLEFISSVIKNKEYRKCLMFLRLILLGSVINDINYSRFTIVFYLESYYYMLNSKIGIVMDYDEIDDKSMFPLNRAIDCIKEKLEGKVDKSFISSIINTIENKSIPDPRRINTAIIELELLLEIMCYNYEIAQQKIKLNINKLFFAMGYEENELVSCGVFHMIMRTIAIGKYSKIEELNARGNLSIEDIFDISIHINIFHDSEITALAKLSNGKNNENIDQLNDMVNKVQKNHRGSLEISIEEWKKMIEKLESTLKENSDIGFVMWTIYENELKKLLSEL